MADQHKPKNNLYPIEGIIYAKPVRTANGKIGTANAGKVFEFPSIILEVTREYNGTTYKELPEFEMGKGVNLDSFDVSDQVEITFSLSGKSIETKGKQPWHKTTAKALYIKHTDRQYNDTTSVGATFEKKKKDEADTVFTPPRLDKDDDDLPF